MKKGKVGKKMKKYKKKSKKKKRNALHRGLQQITVVIHNAFGCGETMISPHHLVVCIIS